MIQSNANYWAIRREFVPPQEAHAARDEFEAILPNASMLIRERTEYPHSGVRGFEVNGWDADAHSGLNESPNLYEMYPDQTRSLRAVHDKAAELLVRPSALCLIHEYAPGAILEGHSDGDYRNPPEEDLGRDAVIVQLGGLSSMRIVNPETRREFTYDLFSGDLVWIINPDNRNGSPRVNPWCRRPHASLGAPCS